MRDTWRDTCPLKTGGQGWRGGVDGGGSGYRIGGRGSGKVPGTTGGPRGPCTGGKWPVGFWPGNGEVCVIDTE